MTREILPVLALCILCSVISAINLSHPNVAYNLFNIAPVTVYNVSNSSDSAFLNGYYDGAFFSAGNTSDTLYVWQLNGDGETEITSIVKRTLNVTLLESAATASTNETFVIGADVTINQALSFNEFLVTGGLGYLAIVTVGADDKNNQQVYMNIINGNSSKMTITQVTNNANSTMQYMLISSWWEDGYFYLSYYNYVYTGSNEEEEESSEGSRLLAAISVNSTVFGIYIQGVSANNTNFTYPSPVQVANIDNNQDYWYLIAGPSNITNSTYIYISYQDPDANAVQQVQVLKSTGALVNTTTLISNDDTYSYFPVGFINSYETFGTIVAAAYTDVYTTFNFFSFNDDSTIISNISLVCPDVLSPASVQGISIGDGYIMYAIYYGGEESVVQVQNYDSSGIALSYPNNLGLLGGPSNYFTDADGGIWFGYTVYGSDDYTKVGFLGRLAAPVSTSGDVRLSVFASLVFIISLFLFI